jgi:uncharacterized protein (DUF302 family)
MHGVVTLRSLHPPAETLDRLEALVRSRGMLVFARIDFSGDAGRAGLSMPPTQLLLFGNPRTGTPLMLAAPASALDLPLKALARQDADGNNWLQFNDPVYLQERHGLSAEMLAPLATTPGLLAAAAGA